MTLSEPDAKAWIAERFSVPRETMALLDRYVAILVDEAPRQNLISTSTLPMIWDRHIRDSAQLLGLAEPGQRVWLDLGSGSGLPGVVVALLSDVRITLVESRKMRIAFLERAVAELGIGDRVRIAGMTVERLETARYGVITARAFAPLERLFGLAARFAGDNTLWVLPKGKTVEDELARAQGTWQGNFAIAPSVTDSAAGIIVARNVKPRRAR